MKKRILIHRGKYAVEENEALYRHMSSKGWTLFKRGRFLSYFRRGEEKERFYRMILVKPLTWRDEELPVPDHSEAGWDLVSYSVDTWVYATDKESIARSAMGPAQSEAFVKALRKKYVSVLLSTAFLFLFQTYFHKLLFFDSGATLVGFLADYLRFLVEYSAVGILFSGLFLLFILHFLYAIYRLTRQLGRIRYTAGWELGETNGWEFSWIRILAICFVVTFTFLSLNQAVTSVQYEMPINGEEGYMILEDLGHAPRKEFDPMSDPELPPEFGDIWKQTSILSEWTKTIENVSGAYLYQMRVTLVNGLDPMKFAQIMIETEEIGEPLSAYKTYDIQGVDAAYAGDSGLRYVLVKGQSVLFIRYAVGSSTLESDSEQKQLLEQAAKKGFES